MAYEEFVENAPTASDTGLSFADRTRNNLMALRDAVIVGTLPGWSFAVTGGPPTQPTEVTYSKGVERLRVTITYGESGVIEDNVTSAVWAYSPDGGTTFETIGTESVTYDGNGDVTATAWS